MARPNPSVSAPPGEDTPLEQFSRELAERFPGLVVKRFVMPAQIRAIREIFIRELSSLDEIEAAIMTDSMISDIERKSIKLTMEAERRECVRLSIVGVGRALTATAGGFVAYEHTNQGGVPFGEPTRWNLGTWAALGAYFGEVNGVPSSEITEGIKEAQIVGAFASPISATPASAASGRSGGASGAST